MTCIVGLVDKGKVFIGGDSAGVENYNVSIRSDEKVFCNGPMLFGFTTSFRMGQLLRYALRIPPQDQQIDDYQYMVTTFIDAVRKCLKEGGFASKKDDVETGGAFLVGYKGKLYSIDDDYQVSIGIDGYYAIGCGKYYALGSLYNTKYITDPVERLMKALETSEYFSGGVRGPFIVQGQ